MRLFGGSKKSKKTALSPQLEKEEDTKEAFLEWVNYHLSKVELTARDIEADMSDGFFMVMLVEIITGATLSTFHPRLVAETPIEDHVFVRENQDIIRDWIIKHTDLEKEEQSRLKSSSFQDSIQIILWILVQQNLKRKLHFGASSKERYQLAKVLFQESKVPFLFEGLGAEDEKGTLILIRTCIFMDQVAASQRDPKERRARKWIAAPQRYVSSTPLETTVVEQRVIRIFLSSTFRDMQNERDQFFQHGAVELKNLAKAKGIEIVFIDLRWGLTSRDSSEGWVVIRCLDSISKCPYFVCSLGARYGWIPDQNKTERNILQRFEQLRAQKPDAELKDLWVEWRSETNKRFPFIDAMPGLSVTEYEIQYAALIDKPACSRVFFYFRDELSAVSNAKSEEERKLYQAENEESRKKQDGLKLQIKMKYGYVNYDTPKAYSDLVTAHLTFAINRDFSADTAKDSEEQAQHQFKMHRLVGFGGRAEFLGKLVAMITSQLQRKDQNPIVLAAESGIGKSSLMAAAIRELERHQDETMNVFYHFVGCTNFSNFVESICVRFWKMCVQVDHLLGESKTLADYEIGGINELFRLIETANKGQKYIFLIDAINQLCPSRENPVPHLLTWLPKKTPLNTAMVVSTIDSHPSCQHAIENGLEPIPVTKLSESEIYESVVSFLHRYDKSLNSNQIHLILAYSHNTGHPLYLRIVLDEIRVFGVYERLSEELNILLSTNGVVNLYSLIINRWRAKYNVKDKPYVDVSMRALYVSRIGLNEGDLDKYMESMIGSGFDLSEWKSFFFTLSESLFVRNGRYMFFHQLLLETTEKYFFEEESSKHSTHQSYGTWLYGQYADVLEVDEELAAEICFQLVEGECYDLLVEYLTNEHVVINLLGGRYRYEFFGYWRILNSKGVANYKDTYKSLAKSLSRVGDLLVDFFLESYENSFLASVLYQRLAKRRSEESKVGDYFKLGCAYKNMHNWEESIKYFKKCLSLKEYMQGTDSDLMMLIHDEIGFIYQKEKRFEEALKEFRVVFDARIEKYGDQNILVAQSRDHFGDILLLQNRTVDAAAEYRLSMEIRAKNFGYEHPSVAKSLENMGHVLVAEKNYEESIAQYERAVLVLRNSFGEKHPTIARVLSHISKVYIMTNRKNKALSLLSESAQILVETMGDNDPDVVDIYDVMGDIHHEMKEYHEALDLYIKTSDIRKRTFGEQHVDFATSLENIGRTNYELHSLNQVIDYFERASKIRKLTKTTMSLTDEQQSAKIATFVKSKGSMESFIQLTKTSALRFSEHYSLENWDSWLACQELDKAYKELNQHREAIEFWETMRNLYENTLGWSHRHSLLACSHISHHFAQIGIFKAPSEFSKVTKFIAEALVKPELNGEWDRSSIIESLFQIVYQSRDDTAKSKQASESISMLNFMGVSFDGVDFSGVIVPYADLSYSSLNGTSFAGANINGVSLVNTFIGSCMMDSCDMENIRLGLPRETLSIHKGWIMDLSVRDGCDGRKQLISGCGDYKIRVWDIATGKVDMLLEGHSATVMCARLIQGPNSEEWLASSGDDTTIRIWDMLTGNLVKVLDPDSFNPVYCLVGVRGPEQEYWLASGSKDNNITIWDISSGERIKVLEGHSHYVLTICVVHNTQGNAFLASAGGDNNILIWDVISGSVLKKLEGHIGTVNAICAVEGPNNENWLASASDDKTVRIWDIESGAIVKVLQGHSDYARCVCGIKGPQGESWLATGGNDSIVRIWDLITGNELVSFQGQQRAVITLCYIKNVAAGEYWLASGSFDSTIRFWDLRPENWSHYRCAAKENVYYEMAGNTPGVEGHLMSGSTEHRAGEKEAMDSRKLKGGDISLRNTRGLSFFNKHILLSHGAVSFDEDFVQYCSASDYTPFQAKMMGFCFENGLGTSVDFDKATLWTSVFLLRATFDFEGLKKMCEGGSVDAFGVLRDMAVEDAGGVCKYPLAAKSLAECFERGWAVEKDTKTAVDWFDKAEEFGELKRLAIEGFTNALEKLKLAAMKKNATGPKYPIAGKLLGECYENGWLGEANLSAAVEWYGRAKSFEELRRLAKQGSAYAFKAIKDISETRMGHQLRYPEAVSIVAECIENGWGC